jgi:chorismate mutase-like protein
LVDAAAQRLAIAEPVAAFKWSSHGSIEDPGRVQQELRKLGAFNNPAAAEHIDPGYVTRVFGDQIDATKAIEYSRFAVRKLNPSGVPPAPPDLSASRSTIDGLNQMMLTQIVADWTCFTRPPARSGSTPPLTTSCALASSTVSTNELSRWRLNRIARVDLFISHQFLKLWFGRLEPISLIEGLSRDIFESVTLRTHRAKCWT